MTLQNSASTTRAAKHRCGAWNARGLRRHRGTCVHPNDKASPSALTRLCLDRIWLRSLLTTQQDGGRQQVLTPRGSTKNRSIFLRWADIHASCVRSRGGRDHVRRLTNKCSEKADAEWRGNRTRSLEQAIDQGQQLSST